MLEQKRPGFGERAINRRGGERKKKSVIHILVFLLYLFAVKLFHKSCNG